MQTNSIQTRYCPADAVESKFWPNPENRVIDPQTDKHILRLAKDIEINGFSEHHPLIVNNDYMILSGHHRYYAAILVNSGVYYKMVNEYNIDVETHCDDIQKKWTMQDWITKYANSGVPTYMEINEFTKNHPYISIKLIESILENKANHQCADTILKIKSGNYVPLITFKRADIIANALKEICELLPEKNYKTLPLHFCFACLAMFKAENYSHAHFMKNFSKQSSMFVIQHTRKGNIARLDEIYNRGLGKANRISISE